MARILRVIMIPKTTRLRWSDNFAFLLRLLNYCRISVVVIVAGAEAPAEALPRLPKDVDVSSIYEDLGKLPQTEEDRASS